MKKFLVYLLTFLSAHTSLIAQCQQERFLNAIKGESTESRLFADAVHDEPMLIDTWEALDNAGLRNLENSLDDVKDVRSYMDDNSLSADDLTNKIKEYDSFDDWKRANLGRNADDALEAIVSPLRGGGKYTDDVLDELKRAFPDEASLKKIVDEDLVESWSLSTTLNLSEINSVQLLERFSELTKNTNFKDFISRFIREDTWSWSDKMSKFDEVCIKYWTTKAGYKDFNNALINGESLSQFSLSYKTSLLEALSKLENHIIPSGGSLSRGTVINLQDFNSKYFKGNEFPESFFTATSKNHETAEGFMLRRICLLYTSPSPRDA